MGEDQYVVNELRFCETISVDKEHPSGIILGFRSCLESVHDEFMQDKAEAVEAWRLIEVILQH